MAVEILANNVQTSEGLATVTCFSKEALEEQQASTSSEACADRYTLSELAEAAESTAEEQSNPKSAEAAESATKDQSQVSL